MSSPGCPRLGALSPGCPRPAPPSSCLASSGSSTSSMCCSRRGEGAAAPPCPAAAVGRGGLWSLHHLLGSGAAPSIPKPWGSPCTTDGRALVLSEASYQSYRLHVRMGSRLLSLFQKRHWREMRLEQKQETLRSVREEMQLVRRRKPSCVERKSEL